MATIHRSRCGYLPLYLVVILVCINLSSTAAPTSQRSFMWMDDEDYSPFIYSGAGGRPAGFYRDLMEAIFNRMHIPLQCELYPWKRTQKQVEEGLGDGMITTLTKKRSVRFKATEPLFVNRERVFARCDNPKIEEILAVRSIADLKPFTVVETIGSGWSEENMRDLNILWAPTYTAALGLLANGRADIYVLGKEPGTVDIVDRSNSNSPYSEGLKKIVMGRHTLAEIPYSLLIRNDSPYVKIIPEFNRTLQELKKDGTYMEIFNSYFSKKLSARAKDGLCN